MSDGAILLPRLAQPRSRGALLFPVTPRPGETLLSFVARAAHDNHLGRPASFLFQAGIRIGPHADFLSRLGESLPVLAEVLCVDAEDLTALWGAEGLSGSGKRRLGGVHLRPYLIYQTRRRFLPGRTHADGDDRLWMVRHLNFCPDTWQLLVDRCPLAGCGVPLSWPKVRALDQCQLCGGMLSGWKKRFVRKSDRPALTWVLDLFSEDVGRQEAAVRRVPPFFVIRSATDAYELALAFAHAAQLQRPDRSSREDWLPEDLAAGVRLLLDYPRSIWDLYHNVDQRSAPALLADLSRIARDGRRPIVMENIQRLMMEHRRSRIDNETAGIAKSGYLTLTQAGRVLGLRPSKVRDLATLGYVAYRVETCEARQFFQFNQGDVRELRRTLGLSMRSWEFLRDTRLPRIALEQLLAMAWLMPCKAPVIHEAYGSNVLIRASAMEVINGLEKLPVVEADECFVSLQEAFRGIGGREKPWGAVLTHGLQKTFPGGMKWLRGSMPPRLAIDKAVARALVMGGPDYRSPFAFHREHCGGALRDWLEPNEVESYLNCTAQDVWWLHYRGLLQPVTGSERTRYDRGVIEALGRRFITTREVGARLGIRPIDVKQFLEAYPEVHSVGQGFHERDALEPILCAEAPDRTWWDFERVATS